MNWRGSRCRVGVRRRNAYERQWHGGRENVRWRQEVLAEERAFRRKELNRIVPVEKVERISEVQFIRDVPGGTEIGCGRHSPALYGSRERIVSNISSRNSSKEALIEIKHICIAAGITKVRGQIPALPVVRLHGELFGGSAGPRPSGIEITESRIASRIEKTCGKKRTTARLVCSSIERYARVYCGSIGQTE